MRKLSSTLLLLAEVFFLLAHGWRAVGQGLWREPDSYHSFPVSKSIAIETQRFLERVTPARSRQMKN